MQQCISDKNNPTISLCPITVLGECDFESVIDGKIYECKKCNMVAVVISPTQIMVISYNCQNNLF